MACSTCIDAASSSFLIQQFTNPAKSWRPTWLPLVSGIKFSQSTIDRYVANCTRGLSIPDIIGYAYSSDGYNLRDTIWLREPFTNPSANHGTNSSWSRIAFAMTLEVLTSPSYGTSHSDYIAYLQWENTTNHWTQELDQISLNQPLFPPEMKVLQSKVVYPLPNFNNAPHSQPGGHIDIPLNLSYIGYPTNYIVTSSVYLSFKRTGVSVPCSLREVTSWVPLPPPKISLSTDTKSLTLAPGDEKSIRVSANSSMEFPSVVSLNASSNKDITLSFSPRSIILTSSPVGWSTLHIKASPGLINNENGSTEFSLPIVGSISFPIGSIDARTGGTSINPYPKPVQNITTIAHTDIIVANPPSFGDQIGSIMHLVQSNLTQVQGLVAAIVAIVTPITTVVLLVWRTKKKGQGTAGQEAQEKSS